MSDAIHITGARQNNLKNLSLSLPLNEFIVVTGVSGSGKSSLVFDTLYAEGQRRYVETFSPYARQFLERMDKPQVDRIDNIPPAIAIDQTNPVRTSRSTVGTMTELADHFKLLYARASHLFCRQCDKPVRRDSVPGIIAALHDQCPADARLIITFQVAVPDNLREQDITGYLQQLGYSRIHTQSTDRAGHVRLAVVQDRFRLADTDTGRISEAVEIALQHGKGQLTVFVQQQDIPEQALHFSEGLHCADCDISYSEPTPGQFSFNSPIGACETCRGFGRIIGVDNDLVIPDKSRTLEDGAVKPWQTDSFKECQDDLKKMAKKYGVAMDIPFRDLPPEHQTWVLEGDPAWKNWDNSWPSKWYGVKHFFTWLESKAYKMHIRVLLSRYRSYNECPDCHGARLKAESLLWRLGDPAQRNATLAINELMALPIDRIRQFLQTLQLPAMLDEAASQLMEEIHSRIAYLQAVGLGYLTLDRQSRTLSGGEVQRINLTTALGTSLVNTLFVLDEPSIGLHPRDIERILRVITRLRDAGNTLVVVEHDPQIMFHADRLLDIGPGPGERGGNIVAFDSPQRVAAQPDSLTGAYLSGRKQVNPERKKQPIDAGTPSLQLQDVSLHNLRHIDVRFPLNRLVCVSGVSGSGKSTLIQDVLYPALARHFGHPLAQTEFEPDCLGDLLGAEPLRDVVMIDQSPIGKSARSTPVSHVGAWNAIRKRYAALPGARQRGYTQGTFSFNTGTGRCPTCQGSGFEHIEMQFLSDVYLRCPDCNGQRYRPEILQLTWRDRSVADVLEMTVTQALTHFADQTDICTALQPLADVGLDYLKLGQPVPTLSGGEAQRLKLAGYLAQASASSGKRSAKTAATDPLLFLFDEPTTGLHFSDVDQLLKAFDKLLAAGHSLVVIEHNLDVLLAADWVIDLGPEGGDEGGDIILCDTPEVVAQCPASHTGQAMRGYLESRRKLATLSAAGVAQTLAAYKATPGKTEAAVIAVRHAREHNLQDISVDIPRDRMTVITGLSGSGKSTLAFDIIFGEGQRRYLESLNAYARQFVQPSSRPEVDSVRGIPPTVAIEQRTSRGGRKSTVGTLTEIQPFLRLLYARLGTQYCPDCRIPVVPQSPAAILQHWLTNHAGQSIEILAPLVVNRKGLYTDLAKWARGKGYEQLRVDGDYLPTQRWPRLDRYKEHVIDLPLGITAVTAANEARLRELLDEALRHGKGIVRVLPLGEGYEHQQPVVFSTLRACPGCGTSFPEPDPRLFSYNAKHGWCPACYGTGEKLRDKVEDPYALDDMADKDQESTHQICAVCQGARLNPVARAVRFHDTSLPDLSAKTVADCHAFFRGLTLAPHEADIARDLLNEIDTRLGFLQRVGLDYLTLDRAAPTLSGGEAQRIRLAAQLGTNLRGVCYILDEPTIGLHPRDNTLLLNTLTELRDHGNTVLVVEHDEDTIRRADWLIDLGPGAGAGGGRITAAGDLETLMRSKDSPTGQSLRQPMQHPQQPPRKVSKNTPALTVTGACLHNLQNIDVRVPLGRLTVITGVSGSGKSTLARDVIEPSLAALLADANARLTGCAAIDGWQQIDRVLEVDQTPIGKTPRSCPATYIGFWDAIRKLYAGTFDARAHGWTASRFSFNTGQGRCPDCQGQGQITIEMNFLPNVRIPCETCGGSRFNAETNAVTWQGYSIGDILAMPVDNAINVFTAHPAIAHPLKLLQDVGLGYLTLGQPSPTLSGGEAQRIKLVTELAKVRAHTTEPGERRGPGPRQTLYILDEPTVGLHMQDIARLTSVLHRLVDAGHSVLIIEHDLDIMAEADWLIDLGPEGGKRGGQLVVQGSVAQVCRHPTSHTAGYLDAFLLAHQRKN